MIIILAEMLCVYNFYCSYFSKNYDCLLVFRSTSTCNMTSVSNIAQLVGIEKHARTVDQENKLCSTGIKVETSVPVNNQHTTTATMTLVSHVIILLTLRAGKMNQILRCDWLPEQAR